MRFDPEQWAAVYEDARGPGLAFRRGADLAFEAVVARGGRWADVGCGTGHLAARLATAGIQIVGVDADPAMVAAARARFPELSFAGATAESLPFGDGELDGVVATSLAGCLADPAPFLREARRAVRPGGHAVVTFTNRGSVLHGVTRRLPGSSPLTVAARTFSTDEAASLLRAAGFDRVDLRLYNCFVTAGRVAIPPPRLAARLERWAGPRVARNVLAVGRTGRARPS